MMHIARRTSTSGLVIEDIFVYNRTIRLFLGMHGMSLLRGRCTMTRASFIRSGPEIDIEELQRLRARLLPPYRVILFNDDYNEMDYVVFALLHAVSSLTQQEAEQIMLTAHLTGNAIVIVCPKETAEYYQERLLSYGLTATIEPD